MTARGAAGARAGTRAGAHADAGATLAAQVIVIAKEPVPGRVKTRLTPPFTPGEAALLAEAALADSLAAASVAPVARRVLALAGSPGPWLPPGFDVIAQSGGGLDERLGRAFADCYAGRALPMVLIGMDTPQVTPSLLAAAARPMVTGEADAVFGPAADGGFWLLGLRRPDPSLIAGVPMSTPDTGRRQLERLTATGLRVRAVPELADVDTYAEARQVAALIPGSRFAEAFARVAGARPLGVPNALSGSLLPTRKRIWHAVEGAGARGGGAGRRGAGRRGAGGRGAGARGRRRGARPPGPGP